MTAKRLLIGVFSVMLMLLAGVPASAAIPQTQRDALLAFFVATGGPGWTQSTNWNGPPGTECTWFGVTCNTAQTTVRSMSLNSNNLVGSIPAQIGDLPGLQFLVLSSNQLSGNLPSTIGNLTSLFFLSASFNQLTGALPPEIGFLTNLQSLDFAFNRLDGTIPPEIGNLVNLQELQLFFNPLSGTIPKELGNLTQLILIQLDGPNTTRGNLTGTIPPELASLTNLLTFSAGNQQLSGPVPLAPILSWTNLDFLGLAGNQFTGPMPPELSELDVLTSLDLSANPFDPGPIPIAYTTLPLDALSLIETNRTGTIPPEIGNLTALRVLRLTGNRLEGTIPSEIGMTSLCNLWISANNLRGPIPDSVLALTALGTPAGNCGGRSLFGYNALFTNNPAVDALLDGASGVGDWERGTQTVAPANVRVDSTTETTATISWDPIVYTTDPGGYEVLVSSGDAFRRAVLTADKTATSATVTGLAPATTYSFAVRTITFPHAVTVDRINFPYLVNNQVNTVISDLSNVVSAATATPPCPDSPPVLLLPVDGSDNAPMSGQLSWSNVGAATYTLYFGSAGSGCSAQVFSGSATSQQYFNLTPGQEYEWRVEASTSGCPTVSSACSRFRAAATCPLPATPISPLNGTVSSPVDFTWSPVAGVVEYTLFINGIQSGRTSETTLRADVPNGPLSWFVVTNIPGCAPLSSTTAVLNACNTPPAPVASVVGEAVVGQAYQVQWDAVPGAIGYELEESLDADFRSVNETFTITDTSLRFQKNVPNPPVGFYYRVRAVAACGELRSVNSEIVRVVIVPTDANPNASVPIGSTDVVIQTIFVPGEPGVSFQFTATTDQPWLTVRPTSGILPPEGIALDIVADPSTLSNGTFTGTVILELTDLPAASSPSGAKQKPSNTATSKKQFPVSISLVAPVVPVARLRPSASSLIIPSVGQLGGINSRWQSDVRITNTSTQKIRYLLVFNQAGQEASRPVKQTFIDVDANSTVALDNVVKNFFGIGGLGDAANGFLEIRPVTGNALRAQTTQATLPSASRVTVVSSRTYNVSANGTLGQFIPAVVFTDFVGGPATDGPHVLSLQQIVQNSSYRTNLGLVEASGSEAEVLLTIIDTEGNRLLDIPVALKAGEQRQLNGLLAQQNITLDDGRIEVRVTRGEGRITAYASIVDNSTNDPLLVTGVPLGEIKARRFVFPGAGSLNTASGRFRTDLRVFNSDAVTHEAVMTFYPQSGAPLSRSVRLEPGQIEVLDDVVHMLFGTEGAGAVQIVTADEAGLIVTGRTYAETSRGRVGQFIEATRVEDAAGQDRTLNILQLEDSVRYRTNIGLAEVTGKPVTVELIVYLANSRVNARVRVPLAANEFRQIPLLRELGVGNVYNVRVTAQPIAGEGRITAYGSVIDETSQDPTYVKGQ